MAIDRLCLYGCLPLCLMLAGGCRSAAQQIGRSGPPNGGKRLAAAATQPAPLPRPAATPPSQCSVRPVANDATSAGTAFARRQRPEQIQQTSYRRTFPQAPAVVADDDPFAGQEELSLPLLIDAVQSRNRSVQALTAAWRAATERYPQAMAFDDPVFASAFAPASFGSSQVQSSYLLGAAQRIPWAGKRPLRGEVARAEADSAYHDVRDLRLQLTEAAGLAFLDYYLAHRELELNRANRERLEEYLATARAMYEAKRAMQQDVLLAQVELAQQDARLVELERARRVAMSRINTLMHRAPDHALPPPPAALPVEPLDEPVEELRQTAVARRPDLAALGQQIRAERASLALAYREFYPDLELFGRYDAFWTPLPQRGQVGLNMNVPLYQRKRWAAAREAAYRLSQRRAEYEQRIDDINREVQTAYDRLREAEGVLNIYRQRTLPIAEQDVESARASYVAGQGDFLRLVNAQRQLILLRDGDQEALTNYQRRLIELGRVVGGPLPQAGPAGWPFGANPAKLPREGSGLIRVQE